MRLLIFLLLLVASVIALTEWRVVRPRAVRSVAVTTSTTVTDELIKQRERKERRLLRKKKQKLKELREEIRQLTQHRRQPTAVTILDSAEIAKRPRKDNRWKRKLIEKLKGIVRRLDRIEKQKKTIQVQPVNLVTALEPTIEVTTTAASSTTAILKTSISTPAEDTKMRRIQSSIEQARSGENGTACASHADCRPGRCCQRITITSSTVHAAAICTFYSLSENTPCADSCQCAHGLLCFHPKDNSTKPFCKKAQSSDITVGLYLNEKDGIFLSKKKK